MAKPKQKKLALSLRGGGAKCASYLGVFRAFEEEGIEIDTIIGSSGGALVGSAYALGLDETKILDQLTNIQPAKYLSLKSLINLTVLSDNKSIEYMQNLVGQLEMKDTKIKLYIQATELQSGENVVFEDGEIAQNAVASSAVPWVVDPVEINGKEYIDGDLTSGFANRFLKAHGAEVVIGFVPNRSYSVPDDLTLSNRFMRPFDIMLKQIRLFDQQVDPIDYLIEDLASEFGLNDFKKAKEIADQGYELAKEKIDDIKELLFD